MDESRFDDSQRGEDVAEIGGIAGDDALESLGEGSDEHVSHGALHHLELSASELELMPEAMREKCVCRRPELGSADARGFQKGLRRRIIAGEGRAKLHKGHRADDEAVIEMCLQAGGGRRLKERITRDQVHHH